MRNVEPCKDPVGGRPLPYPLTITIDQTDDGRYRASYSTVAFEQSGLEQSTPAPPEQSGVTRSIEAANLAILMDRLKELLGSVGHLDADEDATDLADARAAMEDVRKNGGTPWEQVEAEMGF